AHARRGWASCPITQNGCLRIMSHPTYPNALPVSAVMDRLAEASASSFHEFWAVSNPTRIHGPRQITDLYLVALAVRHDGQFVTFDASVAIDAIKGAEKKHLAGL